jgi:hypothetical protein
VELDVQSRQQLRQQERAQLKRGEAAIKAGLPVSPAKADLLAITFTLARLLRDDSNPARASAAAQAAASLIEASQRKNPGMVRLACAKGCASCCHTWVGATAPEIFLIASGLRAEARQRSGEIERIIAASRGTAGLSPEQRFGAKLPCPLLINGACSRYRERPAVCRQVTSLDLAACLDEYEGRGFGGEIKVSSVYVAHTRNARVPLMAAMKMAGLPVRIHELSAGLARVLETADAETRWLAGEDILAGTGAGPRDPLEIENAVDLLAKEALALL